MLSNFDAYYGVGMRAPLWMIAFGPIIFALVLWSIFWKGLALWHSAQKKQPWWFVAFLIVNTAGLLEIAYLFFVLKLKFNELFKK